MAPAIPIVEPDAFIETTIKGLLERSEQRQKLFRLKKESLSEIKDFVAHEAASSCSVHAEIQLLFYHEKHPPKIPPRIICSSKKACFLCNLFIKLHGGFVIPSTHGRLYEKWALPAGFAGLEGSSRERMNAAVTKFISIIEEALRREMQSTSRPYPNPSESIILNSAYTPSNQSRATVHTVRTGSVAEVRPLLQQVSTRNLVNPLPSCSEAQVDHPEPAFIEPVCNSVSRPAERLSTELLRNVSRSPESSALSTSTLMPPENYALPASTALSPLVSPSAGPAYQVSGSSAPSSPVPAPAVPPSTVPGDSYAAPCISLERGTPNQTRLTSNNPFVRACTPKIHLTITHADVSAQTRIQGNQFLVTMEWLSSKHRQQRQQQHQPATTPTPDWPVFSLAALPNDSSMTLDLGDGNDNQPRELRVCYGEDVVSIRYHPQASNRVCSSLFLDTGCGSSC
jgi:hypothetical protein